MKSPIGTSAARCRDCHSCIRACPVKAIGFREGQASIVDDRCIACGQCVQACSQKAKIVASDLPKVLEALKKGKPLAASIAPSFLAAFPEWEPQQVIDALYAAGFCVVQETATAVPVVVQHYAHELQQAKACREQADQDLVSPYQGTLISSCCPVIVNLVEIYYPELACCLSRSLSPMLQHARALHRRFPGTGVVFIGPCIGKKQEAARWGQWDVSGVLTFTQLQELLEQQAVLSPEKQSVRDAVPEAVPSESGVAMEARRYPLHRGILAAVEHEVDLTGEAIAVDGLDECMATLEDIRSGKLHPRFVEAMACRGGCIGGPGITSHLSIPARRSRVAGYARKSPELTSVTAGDSAHAQDERNYEDRHLQVSLPSEHEIRAILARIGKYSAADETNCGGCGYRTCREKAIAVYQGLAEIEMCIPYMRAREESVSQFVVETAHTGIIVVDADMIIQDFNPAANRMFNRHGKVTKGSHLACFIDPSLYQRVWETQETIHDEYVAYEQYGLITRQTIYPSKDYHLVVGVITDITAEEERRKADDLIYDETLDKATSVIRHQMKVSQDIAGLLGETTAETKATLLELIALMKERGRR